MRSLVLVLAVFLAGCATTPGVRLVAARPQPRAADAGELLIPSPSWPMAVGPAARALPGTSLPLSLIAWTAPTQIAPAPVVMVAPVLLTARPVLDLPLPQIAPQPAKLTPVSRSWTPVAQAKTPAALPAVSAPVMAPKAAKVDVKTPATVPAPASSPAKAAQTPAPTAAATATLLPSSTSTAADFQWQDINAVAGDAVTLHFDRTNWLYLDPPAQQKAVGFQSISRDTASTTFQFKPVTPGQYTLEFQRQDLVNQSTDQRKVKLTVVAVGTRTSTAGTALSPQTSTVPSKDTLEAARKLAAAGKTAEAVQQLLQSYRADDARINLELARLLNQSGQDDQALTYLDKNLTITGPDFQDTLILGTRLAATRNAATKLPAYVKLWTAGTTAPPEDLFVQVFQSLVSQKLFPMAKDWSGKYVGWYPAPKLRDQYLFSLGQLLEEPGDFRDVKGAYKAYDEVVKSYPLSVYWKAAGERASYLNRHFLQVR